MGVLGWSNLPEVNTLAYYTIASKKKKILKSIWLQAFANSWINFWKNVLVWLRYFDVRLQSSTIFFIIHDNNETHDLIRVKECARDKHFSLFLPKSTSERKDKFIINTSVCQFVNQFFKKCAGLLVLFWCMAAIMDSNFSYLIMVWWPPLYLKSICSD
jgi:hypothetical protein